MSEKKHYTAPSAMELGQEYMDHVGAMTREGLHFKRDIAKELAHRDRQIKAMERELGELRDLVGDEVVTALRDARKGETPQ